MVIGPGIESQEAMPAFGIPNVGLARRWMNHVADIERGTGADILDDEFAA